MPDQLASGSRAAGRKPMTGPKTKKMTGARWAQFGGAAIFCGWLAFLCISINNEPPNGSSSLNSLRDDLGKAVQEQDADRLQLLFEPDNLADTYAERYVEQLKAAKARGLRPVVEQLHGDRYVVIKGHGSHGVICTPWAVTAKESRWYLDGTPPIAGTVCTG
ncbi:hypothetical protein AB0D04_25840 [Streptomyces sp. NPDC048483]|uniref:hypothetical protein n=1 Tax=Streptomyces sp. NPDC048483 TaxID=3154927 RepID=UPI00344348F1